MNSKSSVSALQEFCSQKKIAAPTYLFFVEDGSFVCRVQVMNIEVDGQGRSKRDAKHFAASNAIKRLRRDFPDIDNKRPIENPVEMPTVDMIVTLRDYCVQNEHPLPIFEIVQQGGTPDTPEFIAMCSVATIKRYGVSEKKKDAKQLAALQVYQIIYEEKEKTEHNIQVATIGSATEDIESERYHKFRTYRELTESSCMTEPVGTLLCDRHNYFMNFHEHIKKAAKEVLNKDTYGMDYKTQVSDLFHGLKITPKISKTVSEKTIEQFIFIELNCQYDVVFANVDSKVYLDVLKYFRDMID